MNHPVLDTIRQRRSIRAFNPAPISRELLAAIADAGQYAPNVSDQAWHFSVVQNPALLAKVNRLSKEYALTCGLPWMEAMGRDEQFQCLYGAPAVIFVSCDEKGIAPQVDTAAATMNLLLAAEALGLGSCWGYFPTQAFLTPEGAELRKELGVPDGYTVYTAVMLGYKQEATPPAPERKPGRVTFVE